MSLDNVSALLHEHGLSQYYDVLCEAGFDSLMALSIIRSEDMVHLRMKLGLSCAVMCRSYIPVRFF